MATRKTLLVLILVNSVFVFLVMVLASYWHYPFDTGIWQFIQLKEMHKELIEYKKKTGELPKDLELLYRYDSNDENLWFGSTKLRFHCPNYIDVNDVKHRIRYEIKDGEPELLDLGDDAQEGGFDRNMDFGYPKKCDFSFLDFIKTEAFRRACLWGLFVSFVITGSIALQWHSKRIAGKESSISIAGLVFVAILFGLVEIVLAFVIMLLHVFPHH